MTPLATAVDHAFVLARRGVLDLWRVPSAFLPGILVPLFFFVIYSSGIGPLARATQGMPGNYTAFVLATILFLSVTNSASAAGFAIVRDIESGYFDKLLLTPVNRVVLVLGRLMADGARASLQATVVLIVGMLLGSGLAGGVPGFVLLVALATLWSVSYAGVGVTIALRTGSLDATQLAFFVGFPFVFLSPAFGPRELLPGWLAAVAAYNPVTYLIEATRDVLLTGVEPGSLARALAGVAVFGAVTLSLAARAVRLRARATA